MKKTLIIKNQKGASAVEFAIIAPLLFVLLFGIVEFGFLLYNQAMITNAAREGARAGIVFQTPRMDESGIESIVTNYAATHLINFDPSQTLIFNDPSPPQHNDTTNVDAAIAADNITSGDTLTLYVRYDYDFLLLPNLSKLVGGFFTDIQTLRATIKMRYE